MTKTLQGPVRLPDGSLLSHGRVIFTPRRNVMGATVYISAPVAVPITAGTFTAPLEPHTDGTLYDVRVEYWSPSDQRLVAVDLPPVAVKGTGTATLADCVAHLPATGADTKTQIKRGDTINFGGRFVDDIGQPIPLTGMTVSSALKNLKTGAVTPMTVTISSASSGEIEIVLSSTATAALPLGQYQMDVKVTNAVRTVRTMNGIIDLIQEATP